MSELFMLDTNIVSYSFKQSYPFLRGRLDAIPRSLTAISYITEAELLYGAAKSPPEARIHTTLRVFLPTIPILPWTSQCAAIYASLCASMDAAGTPLSVFDGMIAAHALARGLTLVTNDRAFTRVPGLRVEDWTQAA